MDLRPCGRHVAHGLFSALGAEGEIKNLTIEGVIRLTGAAPQGAAIGAFAGYAEGKITSCTNKAAIAFAGSDAANISVCLGGIAGYLQNATLTQCVNDGALTCGTIANTGNGSNSGFHQGGIVGYMKTSSLTECTNNGALSAPSGRSGGIVAVATSGQVTACVNNGKVQDDVNGIFGANPGYKRMGGLAGGASANNLLMQMQSDISGAPVQRPTCVETTAMGAAYLAGLAVGYWASKEDVVRNRAIDRVFHPEITAEERAAKVKGWSKAVKCSYGWAKDE